MSTFFIRFFPNLQCLHINEHFLPHLKWETSGQYVHIFLIKFDKINNFHLFKRFHNFRLNLSKLVKCFYISITRTLLKMMNIGAINLFWSFTEFQSIVKCSFFMQFTVFIHFFFQTFTVFSYQWVLNPYRKWAT